MLGGDGIEAIARIRAEDPDASVVALTAFASDELVAGAFRAGARGYMGKEASGTELVRAVRRRRPRGDGRVGSRDRAAPLPPQRRTATCSRSPSASGRCSACSSAGCTDREIAAALTISVKTVEKHVGSILRKTGAQNRTQAVARARERVAG